MTRRTGRLLMIDDEEDLLRLSASNLAREGHMVQTCTTAEEALNLLQHETFDVVLLDLRLPGMSGLDFLKALNPSTRPEEVIVLTAYAEIETAVQAMKRGAYGYLAKPFNAESVLNEIERVLEVQELRRENQSLRQHRVRGLDALVGDHPSMVQVRKLILAMAPTNLPVLIHGESGTGKELVADALHALSSRASHALIKCNCAAFAPGVLESELFGHVKGAFTGAVRDRRGRFEEAHQGTLFLDEIGDLEEGTQIRLLRVLQEHEVEPVGSTQAREVDVRIITATHQDLDAARRAGRFREDLFHRINGIRLELPPLRDRKSDIPLLAAAIIRRYRQELQPAVERLSASALAALNAYDWPGNVRELENVIKAAMVLTPGATLEPEALRSAMHGNDDQPTGTPDPWSLAITTTRFQAGREQFEEAFIRRMLAETHGNISQAATRMQLGRRNLQRKIQQYRIDVGEFRDG